MNKWEAGRSTCELMMPCQASCSNIDRQFGAVNYPKGPSYTAQFAISRKY